MFPIGIDSAPERRQAQSTLSKLLLTFSILKTNDDPCHRHLSIIPKRVPIEPISAKRNLIYLLMPCAAMQRRIASHGTSGSLNIPAYQSIYRTVFPVQYMFYVLALSLPKNPN